MTKELVPQDDDAVLEAMARELDEAAEKEGPHFGADVTRIGNDTLMVPVPSDGLAFVVIETLINGEWVAQRHKARRVLAGTQMRISSGVPIDRATIDFEDGTSIHWDPRALPAPGPLALNGPATEQSCEPARLLLAPLQDGGK